MKLSCEPVSNSIQKGMGGQSHTVSKISICAISAAVSARDITTGAEGNKGGQGGRGDGEMGKEGRLAGLMS